MPSDSRGFKTQSFDAWVVTQRASDVLEPEDICYSFREAKEYAREGFLPEHDAKVVRVRVTVTKRK
jgi:hypothetical protein